MSDQKTNPGINVHTLRYLQNLHPRFKSALRQAQGVVSEVEPRAAPPNFQFKFDRLFVERAICALQMPQVAPRSHSFRAALNR